MKVLFSNSLPFFLAHGGTQTLLEALMRELACLGVEVEPERWWDENQTGDIIHYMNRPLISNVLLARQKGFKLVMTENLDQPASRRPWQLFAQRLSINLARALVPAGLTVRLGWDTYKNLDAAVYVVEHEWKTVQYLFRAPPELGHIIPHGMESEALQQLALPQKEEDYLISAATVHPRKTPSCWRRRPARPESPSFFWASLTRLTTRIFWSSSGTLTAASFAIPALFPLRKNTITCGARGFALLSQFESGFIAVHEAAAAGCRCSSLICPGHARFMEMCRPRTSGDWARLPPSPRP